MEAKPHGFVPDPISDQDHRLPPLFLPIKWRRQTRQPSPALCISHIPANTTHPAALNRLLYSMGRKKGMIHARIRCDASLTSLFPQGVNTKPRLHPSCHTNPPAFSFFTVIVVLTALLRTKSFLDLVVSLSHSSSVSTATVGLLTMAFYLLVYSMCLCESHTRCDCLSAGADRPHRQCL